MAKRRILDTTLTGTTHGLVAYWKRISWDGPACGSIDVTDVSSTDDWKEFLSGFKDAGQITLTLQYNATLWASLTAVLGTSDTWTMAIGDGYDLEATGFLSQAPGAGGELESGIDTDITIKLSGAVAFAAV